MAFCGYCGGTTGDGPSCNTCGRPIQAAAPPQAPAYPPQQQFQQQQYPPQQQQPYAQQPYQQQQQPYPQQPYGQQPYPPQYPPQQYGNVPPPVYVQTPQPSGMEWRWGYSRLYGIHYGPIPVGVIIVIIIFAIYLGG